MAYEISINQLADFGRGSESAKRTIVAQQIAPSALKIPKYQLAKARIRKFFQQKFDIAPIEQGIVELKQKKSDKKWKITDRNTSVEALQRFLKLNLPETLKKLNYEVIKSAKVDLIMEGVTIKVAPDIILKGQLNGKSIIGAIKIHISKGKPFGLNEAQEVAIILYRSLKKNIPKTEGEIVPEFCFCLDVFSDRLVSASGVSKRVLLKMKTLCKQIKTYLNKVVTIELSKPTADSAELKSILALSINKPKPKDLQKQQTLQLQFWPAKFAEANYWLRQAKMNFRII
jgi:hypothetical protein